MKEYRIRALFTGDVFHDRNYKGKVYGTFGEARADLESAFTYYQKPVYRKEFKGVQIQSREVSEWEKAGEGNLYERV